MNDVSEALRRIWEIVTSDEYVESRRPGTLPWGAFRLPRWLAGGGLNPIARKELLRQLQPFLQLESRSKLFAAALEDEAEDPAAGRITRYVSAQVRLRGRDGIQMLVADISKDPKRSQLLAEIADDLTSLLKEALEWFAIAGRADELQDPSHYDQPSIDPHAQNQHFHEWCYLIDLVRDAFNALMQLDSGAADTLLERWKTMKFPVFRRLIVHAVTEWTPRPR